MNELVVAALVLLASVNPALATQAHDVPIEAHQLPPGIGAYFVMDPPAIWVSFDTDQSAPALASELAHELTHYTQFRQGRFVLSGPDCYANEVEGLRAQAATWRALNASGDSQLALWTATLATWSDVQLESYVNYRYREACT